MGDRDIPARPEEQYPLLKMDGSGDIGDRSPPTQTMLPPGWTVTCTEKKSWFSRWPELISACWMTLILIGISLMVFYALGMGTLRRQQFIIVKCNSSRPESQVFYHQIVPRGGQIHFFQYSEYLAYMTRSYPLLRFNVFFLIDDSNSTPGSRHNSFINKFIPYYPFGIYSYKMDEDNKRAMDEFQKRYQNINLTIVPLSKYMTMTSMKYKWKTIPHSILPFYLRVFSVWKNGGVGMDLTIFNNKFNTNVFDRKVDSILKQHNDGIRSEDYTKALKQIEKDQEKALFSTFYDIIGHLLNETRLLINRTLYSPATSFNKSIDESLTRTHRSKREAFNGSINIVNTSYTNEIAKITDSIASNYETDPNYKANEEHSADKHQLDNFDPIKQQYESKDSNNETHGKFPITANNSSDHIVLFYDFSFYSDNFGSPNIISDNLVQPNIESIFSGSIKTQRSKRTAANLLSLDAEGSFIAASSKLHPFLSHLISAGCQRLPPKFAIQDAILTQCSGFLRNDVYCNNIYIL